MVSIIIPTYNGSDKILLSVLSSLNQTYDNIEIIVVDDNGAGTYEQKQTENNLASLIKNKKIKYIVHEKNINGSAARNTGFSHSKGDYVCFLDDDDFMHENKIAVELSLLKKGNYDIVICGSNLVHENGKGYISKPFIGNHMQRDYLCNKLQFNTSTLLIKREVICSMKGFDETFKRHQDFEFCIRAMSDYKFGATREVLLTKYATNRNIAKNPKLAEEYMDYFVDKLMPFISLLPESDKEAILKYRRKILLINFLISKDITEIIQYCKRKKISIYEFFIAFLMLLSHVIKRFSIGERKISLTYDEAMEKLIKKYRTKYNS